MDLLHKLLGPVNLHAVGGYFGYDPSPLWSEKCLFVHDVFHVMRIHQRAFTNDHAGASWSKVRWHATKERIRHDDICVYKHMQIECCARDVSERINYLSAYSITIELIHSIRTLGLL